MNLEYGVLWIDDSSQWIRSVSDQKEAFAAHILSQGFQPNIATRTTEAEIALAIEPDHVDLLLVDYNLVQADDSGLDVIAKLRQHTWLTDIVFYSTTNETVLHEQLVAESLDGVYIASRDTLFDKARKVFDLAVKKVLDLENMRGLVMAGAADVHHLLTDFIRAHHSTADVKTQASLHEYVAGKLLPRIGALSQFRHDVPKDKLTAISKAIEEIAKAHRPLELDELLATYTFDSMNRLETVRHACKADKALKVHLEKLKQLDDLLHWRNALAHQAPSRDGNGAMTFRVNNVDTRFDFETARGLRLSIQAHQATLQDLVKQATQNKKA